MSFLKPNGKDRFIILMAAGLLNRGVSSVTEAQYKDAKALFLAKAYDATPEVVKKMTDKLRGVIDGQSQQS